MKKIFLFLLLFSGLLSFAQTLSLEHTYAEAPIKRILLEVSGEKYYYIDYPGKSLHFFNANHTPWKTIVLPVPTNTSNLFIDSVSEHKINPDDNIEIVFSYYYYGNGYQDAGMVVNENGTILLNVPNANFITLSEIDGLPNKLIATDVNNSVSPEEYLSAVYSIDGFGMENFYPNGEIHRVFLENFGEKYYIFDKVNGLLKLYNSNHLFWKSIALPKPAEALYREINFISDHQLNNDNAIEVGYSYYWVSINSLVYEAKIVTDNNVTLLTVANGTNLNVSLIDGAPNKLMATIHNGNTQYGADTKVFQIPSLVAENTYTGKTVARIKLDVSGEKYYTVNINDGVARIYNANHGLWKSIGLPNPDGLLFYSITHISENKVNDDDFVELAYSCGNLDISESIVINENANILTTVYSGESMALSELPGVENKFIAHLINPGNYGAVYAMNTLNVANFKRNSISAYPNPASDFLTIQSETSIVQANLFDCRGILVLQNSIPGMTGIDVRHLDNGIYFLQLTDINHNQSALKIIVLH
ncbi:MAG: T9SS type A sorting domain-containing protein [Flavobacterium sp.]|nr:T9SS type A sorting domain-containing protein [Flavobacterium sp.]